MELHGWSAGLAVVVQEAAKHGNSGASNSPGWHLKCFGSNAIFSSRAKACLMASTIAALSNYTPNCQHLCPMVKLRGFRKKKKSRNHFWGEKKIKEIKTTTPYALKRQKCQMLRPYCGHLSYHVPAIHLPALMVNWKLQISIWSAVTNRSRWCYCTHKSEYWQSDWVVITLSDRHLPIPLAFTGIHCTDCLQFLALPPMSFLKLLTISLQK